ncbi:hypothetical protein QJS66_16575 [Kocuria rhizophila]|nr:hypothetical protein QJS66_16575 [Kocuria rhizophila]
MPTIVKPATPTGYVTEACVRLMLDSGLLPEGSLTDFPAPPGTWTTWTPRPRGLHRFRRHRAVPARTATCRRRACASPRRPTPSTPPSWPRTSPRTPPEFEAFVKSVDSWRSPPRPVRSAPQMRRVIMPREMKTSHGRGPGARRAARRGGDPQPHHHRGPARFRGPGLQGALAPCAP